MASGKGVRIGPLTDEELAGSGFFDLLKKIGRAAVTAGKFVKDNIIDSNLYQTSIKPEVRKLVDSGEAAISGVLPSSVANVSKTLIDALGARTGAYGLIEIPKVIPSGITNKKRVAKNAKNAKNATKSHSQTKSHSKAMENLGGSFVVS
jgi:hypothetical protein